MTRWVFIGSGPSAPMHVDCILPKLRPCKTITTNAGLKLLPNPDVYFCADRIACQRYHDLARKAQAQGTWMVTLHRHSSAIKERRVEWYDEFIVNGVDPPLENRWSAFNQSGAFCLEYACRHGATEVHILGCPGYSDERSYFDQEDRLELHLHPNLRHKIADSETNKQFIKRTTFVVECFRNVRFVAYGTLNYTIDQVNWHVAPV